MKQDVVVIGGGPAGLVATSGLSQLGLKVTLIEQSSHLGGDCLHHGCVPSKSLIHAAKRAHDCDAPVNFEAVMQHVRDTIARIQPHDDPKRFESYGARVLFGEASFQDANHVRVNNEVIAFKKAIIATGSSPKIFPIPGLDTAQYDTNETIFQITTLPKQLVILGGGVIGIELAQAFARLGSQVHIVEAAHGILMQSDGSQVEIVREALEKEGVSIHCSTTVKKIENNQLIAENLELPFDALLVATGRQPNIQALNLDAAGICFSDKGIPVNQRCQTNQKHIYAIGDVMDFPYKFTHMSEYEAGIAIANIAFKWPKKMQTKVIPSVVFTDPELAQVGLTEQQATKQGIAYEVYTWPFTQNDRAIIENDMNGFAKILIHKKKLLGASIVGSHAGELINEFALLMNMGGNISHISGTIHPYPTRSQINRHVVNNYFGKLLFSPWTKRMVRWISTFS